MDLTSLGQIKKLYFSAANGLQSISNLKNSLSSFMAMQKVISMIFGRAQVF